MTLSLLSFALVIASLHHYHIAALAPDAAVPLTRRGAVNQAAVLAGMWGGAQKGALGYETITEPFASYQVVNDDANQNQASKLQIMNNDSFLKRLGSIKSGAVWLGEHHNAKTDHKLQAHFLRELHTRRGGRKIAVGLEQIQVQFQPILDQFIAGDLSLQTMRDLTQYDKRWIWPFDLYEPIFMTAKALEIPLIALNVNSEDLAYVETGGLPGMPRDRLETYIGDASGFAAFVRPRQFRTYVDYVIEPSYKLHQDLGLLKHTMSGQTLDEQMSFRNFLSGRLLWDESMAYFAYKWTQKNPDGLLVGLVGSDHGDSAECVSVLLNPTLVDSRPSGLVAMSPEAVSSAYPEQITLQLHYKDGAGSGVLSLADYLVIG